MAKNLQIEEIELSLTPVCAEVIQFISQNMMNVRTFKLFAKGAHTHLVDLSHLSHAKINLCILCDDAINQIFHLQNVTQITLGEGSSGSFESLLIEEVQNLHNLEKIRIAIDQPISSAIYKQMMQHAKKLRSFHRIGKVSSHFDENDYGIILKAILAQPSHQKFSMKFKYFNYYDRYKICDDDIKLTIFNKHPSLTVYKYCKSNNIPRYNLSCCIA